MQHVIATTRICAECGSSNIDYDPVHESKYCRDCGTVIETYAYQ